MGQGEPHRNGDVFGQRKRCHLPDEIALSVPKLGPTWEATARHGE